MSTKVLAAGCTTSNSFMMVAPSLEIVVLPMCAWCVCVCVYVCARVCACVICSWIRMSECVRKYVCVCVCT